MVVLALDTATRQGSVALFIDDIVDARVGDAARTHGERLPGELLDLLGARGLTLRDVDTLAVVAGPGSFTGLRVGMASIQGLALVTERLVVPVPTLEAMAEAWRIAPRTPHPAPSTTAPSTPHRAPSTVVLCALDGQRGDVFFGAWRVDAREPIETSVSLIEPAVGTPQELVARVKALALEAPPVLLGIGLDRHAPTLAPLEAPIEPMPVTLAESAARIAARRPDRAVSPHALRPLYIRRPDAELARERAGVLPR